MSSWVQVTGSFYIHSWQTGIGDRLKGFMRDNFHRIPEGSEGALDWGVMQSTEHITGSDWKDGKRTEIYGCGQLHIFGSLRDMTLEKFEEGLLDFLKTFKSAHPIRLGQVCVDGGYGQYRVYVISEFEKNIKVVEG